MKAEDLNSNPQDYTNGQADADNEDSDDSASGDTSPSKSKTKVRRSMREIGRSVKQWVEDGNGPAAEGAEEPK